VASGNTSWHESLRAEEHPTGSSDRSFGFVFAAFFGFLGALALWRGHGLWFVWLPLSAIFLILALLVPTLLAPLNRLWMRLGRLLSVVVNPVVMAVLFFGVLTPVGWLMKATGKDPLRRKFEPDSRTYWIPRAAQARASRMREQF
jgi:hypothetical protein